MNRASQPWKFLAAALAASTVLLPVPAVGVAPAAAPAQAPTISTLDWGDEAIEYYSDGVVLGYRKGEDAGVRILGNNLCFTGTWVGTGKWMGSYYAANSKYGDATVVRSAKGKTLTVTLPDSTTAYTRVSAKKAAKLWGTKGRAKKALHRCWS